MNVHERFKNIDTIIMDVDGVLTDGTLLITEDGDFLRRMNVRDGMLLKMAQGYGIKLGVITGGSSKGVKDRLTLLGASFYKERVLDKDRALDDMVEEHDLNPETIMYIGDDLPDIALKGKVHILCAPHDAIPEMLAAADYICEKKGGQGCVREIIEKVLKSRGLWVF